MCAQEPGRINTLNHKQWLLPEKAERRELSFSFGCLLSFSFYEYTYFYTYIFIKGKNPENSTLCFGTSPALPSFLNTQPVQSQAGPSQTGPCFLSRLEQSCSLSSERYVNSTCRKKLCKTQRNHAKSSGDDLLFPVAPAAIQPVALDKDRIPKHLGTVSSGLPEPQPPSALLSRPTALA